MPCKYEDLSLLQEECKIKPLFDFVFIIWLTCLTDNIDTFVIQKNKCYGCLS